MINKYLILGRRNKEEGEKPFWISFADLMTALMVMFLLVMSVALLAVTDQVSAADRNKAQREQEIDQLLAKIEKAAEKYPGILVDKNRAVIDFGDRARFDTGSSTLSNEQAQYLSQFVSEILVIAQDKLGNKWLKRIVAEGYADQRGDYLLNLNLSLQRSQRVLCALLSPPLNQAFVLTPAEKEQVRDYFLVGGYSFNSAKKSLEESRRIELRLEFFGLDEAHPALNDISRGNFGSCRI
ncbi:MAG: flagellar motor protein MotB [Gallionella sp.]|jgi:outer membrane protein OmpA-like peptidoglycan-associated protein